MNRKRGGEPIDKHTHEKERDDLVYGHEGIEGGDVEAIAVKRSPLIG